MKNKVLMATITSLLVVTALPALAAPTPMEQEKAERVVKLLAKSNFETLKDKKTRILLYKNLGAEMGGNETLIAQMQPYAGTDYEILEQLRPLTQPKEEVYTETLPPTVDSAPATAAPTEVTTSATSQPNKPAGNKPVKYSFKTDNSTYSADHPIQTEPTNEYDALNLDEGHGSVMVGVQIAPTYNGDSETSFWTSSGNQSGKTNLTGKAIIGLGNNLGLAYRYNKHGSEYNADFYYGNNKGPGTYNGSIQSHELDVLYKVAPGLAVTAGATYKDAKDTLTVDGYSTTGTDSGVSFLIGLEGKWQLNRVLSLSAATGWGPKLDRYEIGLGFNVADNTELYLGYSDYKYKGITLEGTIPKDFPYANLGGQSYALDGTAKLSGFTAGVNFKF